MKQISLKIKRFKNQLNDADQMVRTWFLDLHLSITIHTEILIRLACALNANYELSCDYPNSYFKKGS